MALPVVLKSGKNYIALVLAEDVEFVDLLQNIVTKFLESEKFFKDQSLALMFEGKALSDREKLIVLDAISEYTSVKITRIIEADKVKEMAVNIVASEASQKSQKTNANGVILENSCFIDRDVLAGEKIVSSHNIVVTGDVRSGAILKAGENIIVLGDLLGQAIAGNNPDAKNPYILAMEFNPENYRIGRILGNISKNKKGLISRKVGARIATLVDGEIEISKY